MFGTRNVVFWNACARHRRELQCFSHVDEAVVLRGVHDEPLGGGRCNNETKDVNSTSCIGSINR